MAQNLQPKITNYLIDLVNQTQAFVNARNALKGRVEEWNSNGDISGLTQANIDATTLNWLTPTYVTNLVTVADVHLEAILAGTGVAAGPADLIHFLRIINS